MTIPGGGGWGCPGLCHIYSLQKWANPELRAPEQRGRFEAKVTWSQLELRNKSSSSTTLTPQSLAHV